MPAAAQQAPDAGYRSVFDAGPVPMWVFDRDTLAIVAVNDAAVRHAGLDRPQQLAMTIVDLLPAEDVAPFLADLLDGPRGGAPATRRQQLGRGPVTDVEMTLSPVTFADRPAVLLVAQDVGDRLRLEAALGTAADQFVTAQALANVGIFEWEIATDTVFWSAELYRIAGLTPAMFPGTAEGYLAVVHPDDRPAVEMTIARSLETGEPFESVYRIVRPDGTVRWLSSQAQTHCSDGRPVRLTGACQDVTVQKEAEDALSRLALADPLTGLPNRTLFMDRLTQALRRLGRQDGVLAVLFVDLDRFKSVNDRLGHAAGDEVLIAVGARLREVLRPQDTVARLGGDEFVVLCDGLEEEAEATLVAGRILSALETPVAASGQEVVTSASIGIALARQSDVTADALLRDADVAMYRAKETGRHRFELFDHAARERSERRLQTSDELRRAVRDAELRVVYQPILYLDEQSGPGGSARGVTGPAGLEALVRWQHPVKGLLTPAEFIQVAEETGLIVPLGSWVLRQACADFAALEARGAAPPLLSVNLSARQLATGALVELTESALSDAGLEPGRLCFEITESVLMDDVETAVEALSALRALGVRLAIDDFGTGYSSLGYLRRFPVDIVKLDRTFVAGLGSDSAADAVAAAVINLGHALGLKVVAEGVETERQLTVLRALRCDRGQGYLWSRPLAPEPLDRWLGAQPSGRLEPAPLDLAALLSERAQAVRSTTAARIVLQVPGGLALAFADAGATRTLVDHLLANAVKFSADDRPVVVSAASDRRFVRVSVADYGIGMTADEAARCFEPFWQADVSSPEFGGAGVGLYIVRSLVEAMGGHVAVRSARGHGSTFTFALPRSARDAQRSGRPGSLPPGVGEDSSIREFMRQIGVPNRRGT